MSYVPLSPDSGPPVALELGYSLKVRDAMSSPAIAAGAEDSLRVVRRRMRDRCVTGIPIGDGIEALDRGRMGELASGRLWDALRSRNRPRNE